MVKETTIDVSGQVILSYDENSEIFKETFSEYKEVIDPSADISDMLKHVACYVQRYGLERMIEGVGYVKLDSDETGRYPYSGIAVQQGFDDFDFSIF